MNISKAFVSSADNIVTYYPSVDSLCILGRVN